MHVRVAEKPVFGSMYDQSVMSWTAATFSMVPGSSVPEKRPRSPVLSVPPLEPAGPQMSTTKLASDQTLRKSQPPSDTKLLKATVPGLAMTHTQLVMWSGATSRPNVSPHSTVRPLPSLPGSASLSAAPLLDAPQALTGARLSSQWMEPTMESSAVTAAFSASPSLPRMKMDGMVTPTFGPPMVTVPSRWSL